jgi:L-amino acid ligase
MPVSTYNSRVVVVVDGHSSGAFLAPAFLAHGYNSVHVENGLERSEEHLATFAPETFLAAFRFEGDLELVLRQLAPYDVAHVVAGTESGVELADRLGAALELPTTNPAGNSAVRRHKGLMQQAVQQAGLQVADYAVVSSGREAVAWARAHGTLPVVVKPLRSAGTEGVHVCADERELSGFASKLLGAKNLYGQPNNAVLVQEFLRGTEYMVNSVSAGGEHRITEVWKSVKRNVDGAPVYDYTELILPSEGQHASLAEYVRRVLDALHVRWGPAHAEVIVGEDGLRLLEVSPRLMGSIDASATNLATGQSQIVSSVRALLDPERFLRETPPSVGVERACRGVTLICPRDGILMEDLDWSRFKNLASFHSLRARFKKGDRVSRTRDMFTRPGGAYLVHEDPRVVEEDYRRIRDWEEKDFYAAIR